MGERIFQVSKVVQSFGMGHGTSGHVGSHLFLVTTVIVVLDRSFLHGIRGLVRSDINC